jgi:transcriptional regulator with XRE-family HTH domain
LKIAQPRSAEARALRHKRSIVLRTRRHLPCAKQRRYAHYVAGRREPNLMILKRISEVLDTTPNWLLGVTSKIEKAPETAALIERFVNAARGMTREQLKLCVIQAEAVTASNH